MRKDHLFQVILLLTGIAFSIWLYSLSNARLVLGDNLGFIAGLPLSFFLASSVLTVAAIISWLTFPYQKGIMFSQLLILNLMLWLSPVIVGGAGASHPVAYHTYDFWTIAQSVQQTGHIYVGQIYYSEWPAAWIIISTFSEITKISDPMLYVGLSPIFFQLLFLLGLYPLSKYIFPNMASRDYFISAWIFSVASFTGAADYLSPDAFAYFLFLLILALLIQQIKTHSMAGSVISTILISAMTILHPGGSFTILTIIFFLFLSKRLKSRLLIYAMLLLLAWNLYYTGYLLIGTNYLSAALANPVKFYLGLISGGLLRYSESPLHSLIVSIKLATTVLFLMLGAMGMIIGLVKKEFRGHQDKNLILILLAIVSSIFTFAVYGREIFQRVYLYSTPIISYFGSRLMLKKIIVIFICAILIAAIPLHIVSEYGYLDSDYMSQAQLSGSQYFGSHSEAGNLIVLWVPGLTENGYLIETLGDVVGLTGFSNKYVGITYEQIFFNNSLQINSSYLLQPTYLIMGRNSMAYYQTQLNNFSYYKELGKTVSNSSRLNFVYNSVDMQIYSVSN